MANRYMKNSSTLLIIKEIQITMTCHLIPVRMASTKKTKDDMQGCREKATLTHYW
jgi:hypothetical protein